jgi:hypothetical protein
MVLGTGYLKVNTVAAGGAILIGNASVLITDDKDNTIHDLTTSETGNAPEVQLEAPDKWHLEDPHAPFPHYGSYRAYVRAEGYRDKMLEGVMIFDTTTSFLTVEMEPLFDAEVQEPVFMDIGGHALDNPEPPSPMANEPTIMPRILPEVIIPNNITVHLGQWNASAPNVRVPFIQYIKNVTSVECRN